MNASQPSAASLSATGSASAPGGVTPAVLQGWADESYTCDLNGNRETVSGTQYSADTDNRMTSDGTYTLFEPIATRARLCNHVGFVPNL
jgi:hypothetical protein